MSTLALELEPIARPLGGAAETIELIPEAAARTRTVTEDIVAGDRRVRHLVRHAGQPPCAS